MNEKELNALFNSSLAFDHLIKNKTVLTVYLEDGVKLSGRLLGWDREYLLLLYGKTLQIIPAGKLVRLQAELENDQVTEAPATPELPKPKIIPEPAEGNEVKDIILASKPQNNDKNTPPTHDRLDHLLKNL